MKPWNTSILHLFRF